jgi:excisionase family DNA binding protein
VTATHALSVPDESVAEQAASAVAALSEFLRAHPTPTTRVRICPDDAGAETPIVVPAEAFRLFVEILAELANGNAVTVAPVHAELTTQQAADLLNVSRPYLIGLLEDGHIPFRRVGNRRKVLLADVLDYKRRDDRDRDEILRELTAEAEEHGLGY